MLDTLLALPERMVARTLSLPTLPPLVKVSAGRTRSGPDVLAALPWTRDEVTASGDDCGVGNAAAEGNSSTKAAARRVTGSAP